MIVYLPEIESYVASCNDEVEWTKEAAQAYKFEPTKKKDRDFLMKLKTAFPEIKMKSEFVFWDR